MPDGGLWLHGIHGGDTAGVKAEGPIDESGRTEKAVIESFSGKYSFLSNFYSASVEYDGRLYGTVEAAYQAAKSLDPAIRAQFEKMGPAEAKRKGRQLTLRPDWDAIRVDVMRQLLNDKFRPGRTYHDQLLMTQPHALVEGNYWGDTFWGVCNGVGENWLGRLLMEIRDAARP